MQHQQLSKIECEQIEPFVRVLNQKIYTQKCNKADLSTFISIVKEILKEPKK
jgi:transcription elongation factor GreA-like protein